MVPLSTNGPAKISTDFGDISKSGTLVGMADCCRVRAELEAVQSDQQCDQWVVQHEKVLQARDPEADWAPEKLGDAPDVVVDMPSITNDHEQGRGGVVQEKEAQEDKNATGEQFAVSPKDCQRKQTCSGIQGHESYGEHILG